MCQIQFDETRRQRDGGIVIGEQRRVAGQREGVQLMKSIQRQPTQTGSITLR
jgi:hypothetical protein